MKYLVLYLSYELPPDTTADAAALTWTLVQQRVFATHEEADAYRHDVAYRPATWGHAWRWAHDAVRILPVADGDPATLQQAVQRLVEDPRNRQRATRRIRHEREMQRAAVTEAPMPGGPRCVTASYIYRVWPQHYVASNPRPQFLLVCASCAYVPAGQSDEGTVTCDLKEHRRCATLAEAGDATSAAVRSSALWGRDRREPQDVWAVFETVADDAAALDGALGYLRTDPKLHALLKHVHERWIDGTNPHSVTLAVALGFPASNVVAMLEGDFGGQTYVVCPVHRIRCDETTLRQLITDLNAIEWPGNPPENKLSFFRADLGTNVGGGMGGGFYTEDIWVHARLRQKGLEPRIRAVLAGERARLDT